MDWLEPYKDINNLKAMSVGELNTLSWTLIIIITRTKNLALLEQAQDVLMKINVILFEYLTSKENNNAKNV